MGIDAVLTEAERHLRARVAGVELLGEVTLQQRNAEELCRNLGRLGLGAAEIRWPHCLAVGIVAVARFWYDGDAFWPHLKEAFGLRRFDMNDQSALGQWFEGYLRKNRLPTFAHLVEEGALRFLTPILGHSLIPCALVPHFMERVIWPSVEDPSRYGATAEEIQQLVARRQQVMPRPLQRFIVHGGRVARDILERSLDVAGAAGAGEEPPKLLPGWLQDEIVAWVRQRAAGGLGRGRPRQRTSWRPPVLRFDPVFVQVKLELPYLDDPSAKWAVSFSGDRIAEVGYTPPWKRLGAAESVAVERPFSSLRVDCSLGNGRTVTRSLGGLSVDRPYLVFDARSGRVLADQRYLSGSDWYIVMPASAAIVLAGGAELRAKEDLGEPFGAWPDLTVRRFVVEQSVDELVLVAGREEFRLRRIQQPKAAYLDTPELPPYLAPMTDAVLAFESRLPTVVLPPRSGAGAHEGLPESWVARTWSDRESPHIEMPAKDLDPSPEPGGGFRVRLENLIPGHDVGEWNIELLGPLGQGLRRRLALLPDIAFEGAEEAVGVAGPDLPVARVIARTREGMEVLEEGDAHAPVEHGWELFDRNRNGRIPFRVLDSRTGREVHALLKLPVVQWWWTGHGAWGSAANAPLSLVVEELEARSAPRLRAENPTGHRLALRLYGHAGNLLQEQVKAGQAVLFELASYLTTLEGEISTAGHLRLELIGRRDEVLGSAEVARVRRRIEVGELNFLDTGNGTTVEWQLRKPPENLQARVTSLARPWEDAETAPAEVGTGGVCRATFRLLSPGRYRFELLVDDPWTGTTPLGEPAETWKGSLQELRRRVQGLPPTVEGKLEDLLLDRDMSSRDTRFRELVRGMGPHQAGELLGLVFRACATGRGGELLRLPWEELAPAVTRIPSADLETLITALPVTPGDSQLAPLFVAAGLDRAPALTGAPLTAEVRARLWQLWKPLGALAELRLCPVDPQAFERCSDLLGFPRAGEAEDGAEDDAPGEVRSPGSTGDGSGRGWGLPEVGSPGGREFIPEPVRIAAMKALLSPVPSRPFDRDGWLNTCFETLEGLAGRAAQLEPERDRLIRKYGNLAPQLEQAVVNLLPALDLGARRIDARQYPWAFLCRVSLVAAAARRLVARGEAVLPRDRFAELDDVAAALARLLLPVYERDLMLAEILCCQEFEWRRQSN